MATSTVFLIAINTVFIRLYLIILNTYIIMRTFLKKRNKVNKVAPLLNFAI
nr:MAG TPA: hypothetical protein [Caudoviricetes sp.]